MNNFEIIIQNFTNVFVEMTQQIKELKDEVRELRADTRVIKENSGGIDDWIIFILDKFWQILFATSLLTLCQKLYSKMKQSQPVQAIVHRIHGDRSEYEQLISEE